MKERAERLKTIRKIIKSCRIESQDALLGQLEKEGYTVTQATLSRDLRLLKVIKVPDGRSGYVYTLSGDEERKENEQAYINDFLRGYVSIEGSGNMVVIKTYSGHSDAVALAVDNLGFDVVLGTIAGRDNVVFVCLREGISGEDFLRRMKDSIPGLES